MKIAKKTDRKQKVDLNTQLKTARSQVAPEWRSFQSKLNKVLEEVDKKAGK
ncbi:MAG: hypothetical protein IKI11_00265 [Neisseriaceae bacterium]|nr:hypothetical protein [Neisseriaceae bacterium]